MNKSADPNRRSILRCGTAYSAGVLTAATASNGFHTAAAERDPNRVLKIGLIGCGGRGTGAINDSLSINKNVKLAAVADVDAARCETTLRGMTRRHKERVDVSPEHVLCGIGCF